MFKTSMAWALAILPILPLAISPTAFAQGRCCAPSQWEGSLKVDGPLTEPSNGAIHYDFVNQRELIVLDRPSGGTENQLFEFGQDKEFVFNKTATGDLESCQEIALPPGTVMHQWCDAQGQTFSPPFTLGATLAVQQAKLAGTTVSPYVCLPNPVQKDSLHPDFEIDAVHTVSSCVTISMTCLTGTQTVSTQLTDVTLGIRNPNIFTPPSGCVQ